MAQDEVLPHRQSSCKRVTGDFLLCFWFYSFAAVLMGLCKWKANSCKKRLMVLLQCCPPLPPPPPLFKNWRFYCFIAVCVRGNFCLARFSIPNRWDGDKGTQEEVEQKLMSVSAVQCVSSWLGQPMNKSKFLFLSPPLFSFPPSFLLSF